MVVHPRHGHANGCADVSGVAHGVAFSVQGEVVAVHAVGEAHGSGQVAGVIDKDAAQAQEVAHQACEQDGAILAVAVGVMQGFFGEKCAVLVSHIERFIADAEIKFQRHISECCKIPKNRY